MISRQQHPSTTVWENGGLTDIVVGIDGTDSSRVVLAWAGRLAGIAKAKIRIVHALHPRELTNIAAEQSRGTQSRLLGRRLLRSARAEIDRIDPFITVDTLLTDEPIAPFLGAMSRTLDLIVIGGKPSGPLRDVLFGRHATRIISDAVCPVVVWRPCTVDADSATHPVVVGIDNSASSHSAILGAFWFANALQAPLFPLHMGSPERPRSTKAVDADGHEPQVGSLAWLQARVAKAAELHPGVEVHLHCLEASAEHELRKASETARLVVVGSRGLRPVTGSIRGSVGQSLVHTSRSPILVVR